MAASKSSRQKLEYLITPRQFTEGKGEQRETERERERAKRKDQMQNEIFCGACEMQLDVTAAFILLSVSGIFN